MKRYRILTAIVCLLFVGGLVFEVAAKPPRSSGGSRSFSSPSRSSKPPSRSSSPAKKPSFSSPTRSSKPPSSTTGSKPKFGSPSSNSTGTSGSTRPGATTGTKPKFGSPSSSGTSSSRNPSSSSSSSARATAARKYAPTQRATAPAKSSYTSSSGKSVNVRKDSTAVKTMRSRPSTDYTPAARTQRTEVHITSYGYSQPYSYYHSHSPYYMGGGYSSAYWWMMMEWDASRRARWLYNNQSNIESSAYQKGMQDAAVAAEIARLKTQGAADPNYIDKEFADNPDLMYDQDYVEAAYNPTVQPQRSAAGTLFKWVIILSVLGVVGYFLVFKMRWGK